jgi:hypothetical protein
MVAAMLKIKESISGILIIIINPPENSAPSPSITN